MIAGKLTTRRLVALGGTQKWDEVAERTIYDQDGDVYYVPFIADDGRVGYRVSKTDGSRETFIYLNPSGGSDDGVPNVFVYIGGENDPVTDSPEHFYDLKEEL